MASDLAPEIISQIVDACERDFGALAACSLLNTRWHIISRRVLFSSVTVYHKVLLDFVDLFESPDVTISEFVRELSVQRQKGSGIDTSHVDCNILFPLAEVASKLANLRLLKMRNLDWSTRQIGRVREPLAPYGGISSLSLIAVKLSDLSQVVEIISAFPVLEELKLIYLIMITNMNALPSDVALRGRAVPMTLKRFTLVGQRVSVIESVLEWISGTPDGVDIPLEYLKLGGPGFRITKSVRRLLQGAGSNLQHLIIHPTSGPFYPGWNNPESAPALLDLSHNNQLRILSLEGAMQPTFCHAMARILRQVTSFSLEKVLIPSSLPAAAHWAATLTAIQAMPQFINVMSFQSRT